MADRYWVNDDADGDWNVANNWSSSSGGAGGAGVPGVSDTAIFDSSETSNCTLATLGLSLDALSITTGYTGTLLFNRYLTVESSVTVASSTTLTLGTWASSGIFIKGDLDVDGSVVDNGSTYGIRITQTTTSTISGTGSIDE